MGEKLKLLFVDVITGKPVYFITAPKRIPEKGRTLHRTNQKFDWLAGKNAAAVKKQREATLRPMVDFLDLEVDGVPTIHFKKADAFLAAISFVNSKQYDTTLLKQLRYYVERGDLVGLRRLNTSYDFEFAYYP